jgi:hypothetical protein
MNQVLENFGDTIRSLQTDHSHSASKPGDIELAVKLFDNLSKPKPAKVEEPFEDLDDIVRHPVEVHPMTKFKQDAKKAIAISLLFLAFQQPQVQGFITKFSPRFVPNIAFVVLLFFLISFALLKIF